MRIPYRQNGGYGGTDCTGANGLLCKIFLLSAYEVGWTAMDNPNFPATGAKLSYFLEGMSSSANNKRIATLNGAPSFWWLRPPLINDTKYAALVGSDGDWYSGSLRNNNGIRPAFVLPSDLTVLDDGTVTTDPPQGPPVAHKVKNIYVGVDNLACKVTKGYIGGGDVARCFLRLEPETTGYPFGLFSVSPLQYDFTEIIQDIRNYDNIPLDMDSFVDPSPETDIAWSEYEFWQDTYGNLMREETDESWPEDFSDLIGTGVILWNLTFDPTKVKDADGMPADFINPDTGEANFLIYCDATQMDQYDWASVRGVVYDVYQQAWKIFNPIQDVNFNVGYIGISVPVQFPE